MRLASGCCLTFLSGLLVLSSPAWAALGGVRDSVEADTLALRAVRHVEVRNLYQVHQLELSSGVMIREYVAPNGSVFGVTWKGPFKPNLNQILGNYFARLVAAGLEPHPDHRSLQVSDGEVLIESRGRMRAFSGRAVVARLMPAGVSANEIQ